jgi:hypothetical protein
MQLTISVPPGTGNYDRGEAMPPQPKVKRDSVDRLMRQKVVLPYGVAISVQVHNGCRLVRVESPTEVLSHGCQQCLRRAACYRAGAHRKAGRESELTST